MKILDNLGQPYGTWHLDEIPNLILILSLTRLERKEGLKWVDFYSQLHPDSEQRFYRINCPSQIEKLLRRREFRWPWKAARIYALYDPVNLDRKKMLVPLALYSWRNTNGIEDVAWQHVREA